MELGPVWYRGSKSWGYPHESRIQILLFIIDRIVIKITIRAKRNLESLNWLFDKCVVLFAFFYFFSNFCMR